MFIANLLQPPLIIGSEVATLTGSSNAASANTVYLWAFELQVEVIITGFRWRNTATGGGATNCGIYTFAGNLVAGSDTGATNDGINTTTTATYATPLQLQPGQYFLALACGATDTFQSVSPTITNNARAKRATNALAAGALPLTTGTIVASSAFVPGFAALVSGGLA